ncbi:hypothetical protein AKJ09_08140 [Labilithrix luteola]|uniref:PEGA domain-containing protein n=2 Tax=Labilithrix luteola TaxID=1391654 RepID=A0A0K1Q741_9BACT|nr:hypothetical protein AKJ09_08140 [Labilithrix luteola]
MVVIGALGASYFEVGTAFAEGPRANDTVSAQLFFERGRDAAARNDPAEACRNFEESLRLDFAVGTLFNLANCEEQLGRLASAWQHLREGIDRLDANDPRRAQAAASAKTLEAQLPRLDVRLAAGASGQVLRDGVELEGLSLGSPLPVNPGVHVVTVRAEGRADARYEVTLAKGEQRSLVVAPGLLKGGPDATETKKTHPALRTTAWVTGGVGVAGLGLGLVTGALALDKSKVVDGHCDANHTCDGDGLDALDSAKSMATISTISITAGAALLATGVVLWFVSKPTVDRERAAVTGSPALVRF